MAEEIEPTEEQRAAHAKRMQELKDVQANKTPLNAPRGMGTTANDPTRKPDLSAIGKVTKQAVRKDNKAAVDSLLNVQQSSAASQTKKEDTPKPVRRIQVENVPPELPERPFPLAKLPTPSATNQTLSFPGASNGVFLLGGTLAIVALWSNVINPLIDIGWNGLKSTKRVTMPASGIISLVLFILLITFISTLSPDFANVAFLFVLGLWAVYLIMNPDIVKNVAGYVSQGNKVQPSQPSSDSASGAGSHPTQH